MSLPVFVPILIAVCMVFIFRGPFRAFTSQGLDDLLSPDIQSTAWLHGADPYSPRSLLQFWPKSALAARPDPREMDDGSVLVRHGIPTAYPLTSLVLLAPFSVVPWPIFKVLWVTASVALFFAAVWSLGLWAGLKTREKQIFLLASLLLAPFHTGIATCNVAVVAVELGVIAVAWAYSKNEIAAGLLIAVSVGMKPQIGLVFLAYYLVQRGWKACSSALMGIVGLVSVALVRMMHVPWLASYATDNRVLLSTGVLGDFTERNPTRFGLVNLQVALYPWLHNRSMTNVCMAAICGLLAIAILVLILRANVQDNLLSLSLLSTFSLLPVYHRFYDAALLIIPICWLLHRWGIRLTLNRVSPRHRLGYLVPVATLVTVAVFSIPGGSMLEVLRNRGAISSALARSTWWDGIVMAHAVWSLLLLLGVLLYEMNRYQHRTPARTESAP